MNKPICQNIIGMKSELLYLLYMLTCERVIGITDYEYNSL